MSPPARSPFAARPMARANSCASSKAARSTCRSPTPASMSSSMSRRRTIMATGRASFAEVARVLKPDGVFLYTDSFRTAQAEQMKAELAAAGFAAEFTDVTRNVAEACRLDSPRRRELIRRHAPLVGRLLLAAPARKLRGGRGQQQIPPVRRAAPRLSDDRRDQAHERAADHPGRRAREQRRDRQGRQACRGTFRPTSSGSRR